MLQVKIFPVSSLDWLPLNHVQIEVVGRARLPEKDLY